MEQVWLREKRGFRKREFCTKDNNLLNFKWVQNYHDQATFLMQESQKEMEKSDSWAVLWVWH